MLLIKGSSTYRRSGISHMPLFRKLSTIFPLSGTNCQEMPAAHDVGLGPEGQAVLRCTGLQRRTKKILMRL